jgi:regulator of RNase E activity RraA
LTKRGGGTEDAPGHERHAQEVRLMAGEPEAGGMDSALIDGLRTVPTTVASDAMGRTGAMSAALRPLFEGARLCGPAVTVELEVGSNAGVVRALDDVRPGDVVVVDGRGHTDSAVWGGLVCALARRRGAEGAVIDGSIRDSAEQRALRFPVFCRGVTPAGPPKPATDRVNVTIRCGGVQVEPGDVILGDDDGVVVIPRARTADVLRRSQELLAREEESLALIERGASPFNRS